MRNFKLQNVLGQLSDLTPAELGEVKAAIDEMLAPHLRALGANGDLTPEEWALIEARSILDCLKMVRERTGLGLAESKAYIDRARARGRDLPEVRGTTPLEGDSAEPPSRDFGNGGRWEGHKRS